MSLAVSRFTGNCVTKPYREFRIKLKEAYTIVSFFAHSRNSHHNRTSHLYIGSTGQSLKQCSKDVNDSGFFFVQPQGGDRYVIVPETGNEVAIRRDGCNIKAKERHDIDPDNMG